MSRIKAIFTYILLAIFSLSLTCCEQKGDPYMVAWDCQDLPEIENGELKSIYILEYKKPRVFDRKIELDWQNLDNRITITPSKYVWQIAFRFDFVVTIDGHEETQSMYSDSFFLDLYRFKPIKIKRSMMTYIANPKGKGVFEISKGVFEIK